MWKPVKAETFGVWPYYEALRGAIGVCFPWRSIWDAKVPHHMGTALNKILTVEDLRKCNMLTVEWCCMPKNSGE